MQQINELKIIKSITSQLDHINHPDSYRIAREIFSYTTGDEKKIGKVLKRIAQNEPWEYIRGHAEFMGRDFVVNKATLIPRLETEELVKFALQIVTKHSIKHVIDVGTGSGAIVISIAHATEQVKLTATDISENALETAKNNSNKQGVSDRVNFILTNLLEGVNDINSSTLIIANLPYIPTDIYKKLHISVKDFEPQSALDGGENGMKYIDELYKQIQKLAEKPKAILLEIDPSIVEYVKTSSGELMKDYSLEIHKDFRECERFALLTLN